jgi:predicted membrane GTPase involved in stress response
MVKEMNLPINVLVKIEHQDDNWIVVGEGNLQGCVLVCNQRTGRVLEVFEDLCVIVR